MTSSELSEFKRQLADTDARHGAAIFLILYALIGLDIMAVKDEQERQRVTAMWLAWGIPFLLLGFFIITPEQDAIAVERAMRQAGKDQKRPAAR